MIRFSYAIFLTLLCLTMIGCFAIVDRHTPEEQIAHARVLATGLGPTANPKIWTDGVTGSAGQEVPLHSDTYIKLAEKATPAVVNIFTTQKIQAGFSLGLLLVPLPNEIEAQALGTGFIIHEDGYILTNYHVIMRADEIKVMLSDQAEIADVKIIGADPWADVALLKAQTSGRKLPIIKLADSDNVEVGEMVMAIGNPFGLGHSVTTGVISAKHRILRPDMKAGALEDYLQTSAQINPGNSGGPLLNLRGEAVGINTAMIAGAQGIGFTVPINLVKELMPSLVKEGHVPRSQIGVVVAEISEDLAKQYNLSRSMKGMLVLQVNPSSPASNAGLQKGDVILKVDGQAVTDYRDFLKKVVLTHPGARLTFEIFRRGVSMQVFIITAEAM